MRAAPANAQLCKLNHRTCGRRSVDGRWRLRERPEQRVELALDLSKLLGIEKVALRRGPRPRSRQRNVLQRRKPELQSTATRLGACATS